MFYVPVSQSYVRLPSSYVPVYSPSVSQTLIDTSNSKLTNDLSRVKKDLADLRDELTDLRLEKETCRLCSTNSSTTRVIHCDQTCSLCATNSSPSQTVQCYEACSICYPRVHHREVEENYSRPSSPIHYCSICHDYVIDQHYPPPSPRSDTRTINLKINVQQENKLSEYLSRQLDLYRLRHRYIPEQRPAWIPTAYKHDYPHRRWVTRNSRLSEP